MMIKFGFCTEQLLKKLQSKQTISLTTDGYQINLGLMIQRDPIFLKFTDQEMEYKKLRYQMERKYNLLPKLPKEMYEFPSKVPKGEDTSDDMPTHLKTQNDVRTYFRENSKWYRFTDPTTSDPKSIQYAGLYTAYLLLKKDDRWFFPTTQVEDKKNFWDTKHRLQREISDNQWHVHFFDRNPRMCLREEKSGSKIKGIKTFYFLARHVQGQVQVKNYDDYVWATRMDMNKYLTEKDYNDVIHSLDL